VAIEIDIFSSVADESCFGCRNICLNVYFSRNGTTRNVQVTFDRVVTLDGMLLSGAVITKKQFLLHFEPGQQLSLF
jgi:hypothetical protein